MAEPILLLKPEGSRDRNGAVTLNNVNITTVAGDHGQAWAPENEDFEGIVWPTHALPDALVGTMIVRVNLGYVWHTAFSLHSPEWERYLWTEVVDNSMDGYFSLWWGWRESTTSAITVVTNDWQWVAIAWDIPNGVARLRTNGDAIQSAIDPLIGDDEWPWDDLQARSYLKAGAKLESLVLFDEFLAPEQIDAIGALPTSWTWENVQLLRRFWSHVQIIE